MAVKKNAKDTKTETKSVKKVAAKPAVKPAPKPVAKPAVKAPAKAVAKPATKPVAKAVAAKPAKSVPKPVAKPVAKPAVKAPVKAVAKPVAKAATKAPAKAPAKVVAKAPAKPATKPVAKAVVAKPATKPAKPAPKPPVKAVAKPVKKPVTRPAAKAPAAKLEQPFDAEYLVLMQKDPNWLHAFWEVSEERVKRSKNGKGKLVLRLFDITDDLTVQRGKKRKFHDVEVPADARSWYVENPVGNSCMAVLGSVDGNQFMPILESSPVLTFDKNATVPSFDDEFVRASLGGSVQGNFMSSGFSSTTAESWLNSLRLGSSSESMFSGALSSAALKSNEIAAPKDSVNYGKDFFLWVKTRLIVYGGTRPDAHLQVRGEPFPLNPDGTFSFEEDLPDSTKIIPVFATDKDGDFPTTIVPIVVKRTE
jgi:Uncharacterized protein conserved in bacteria